MQLTSTTATTHRVKLRTPILKSITNTFNMNAMVRCDPLQIKMPRLDAYAALAYRATGTVTIFRGGRSLRETQSRLASEIKGRG